jgi:hypothetical protein
VSSGKRLSRYADGTVGPTVLDPQADAMYSDSLQYAKGFSENRDSCIVSVAGCRRQYLRLQLVERVDEDVVGRVEAGELVDEQVRHARSSGIGQERRQVARPEPGGQPRQIERLVAATSGAFGGLFYGRPYHQVVVCNIRLFFLVRVNT